MPENETTKNQFSSLVEKIVRDVFEAVDAERNTETDTEMKLPTEANPSRRRSRSQYTGQLHLKVKQNDEEWFKLMVRKYEVQNGKFFSLMRQKFENFDE